LNFFAILVVILGVNLSAQAQPNNMVRLVIAFPPGGPSDALARQLADQLGVELGQSVLVENKPGGNGAVAAQYVLNAPNDGKTLWLTTAGAITINPNLYPKLTYDVAQFAPVSLVVNNQEVLVVNGKNPVNDVDEFLKTSLLKKGGLNLTSSGIGSMPHMAISLFQDATGKTFTHIPNKGAAPAITDLLGDHVDGFFGDIPGVLSYIQAGSLKAIGIAASKRNPLLPNVKTFDEMGIKDMHLNNWSAIYVSKGVPSSVLDELNSALKRTLEHKATYEKIKASGADPQWSSRSDLSRMAQNESNIWRRVIQKYNVKAE
jgi:tripartite-type tricarboxylate transporter receptor subunit TctC